VRWCERGIKFPLLDLWCDEENGKYMSDPVWDNVDEKYLSCVDEMEDNAEGYYLIAELKESGRKAGTCCIFPEKISQESTNYDIGYCISKEYWRKGLGSELIEAVIRWIQAEGGYSISAEVADVNSALVALLRKFGFVEDKKTRYKKWGEETYFDAHYFKRECEPMDENLIKKAIAFVQTLFAGNADGHDFDHTMRVYRNAMKLIGSIACDKELVALAALLHDADDYKLFATVNNANARSFLQDSGVDKDRIEKIIDAINAVSFSKNKGKRPDTIEGQIVQDADRLDAIGAIGVARTFAYGGKHGRGLEGSIQHFYDKLLWLKDTMNTEAARKLAEERHKFMIEFLEEWKQELEE